MRMIVIMTVARLSHRASSFVYNTVAVTQGVARSLCDGCDLFSLAPDIETVAAHGSHLPQQSIYMQRLARGDRLRRRMLFMNRPD